MKDFVMLLLFIQTAVLLGISVNDYVECTLNEMTAMSQQWVICIYLAIAEIILLLLYLFVTRKKKTKRRRIRR